jgi:methylenetetrahydrofolate reductase (NADPH)
MIPQGASKLEKKLESGKFAVTAELGPPRGADKDAIITRASLLKGCVDAVNVTDNQTAIVRMSSIAACVHILKTGLEPVMQMTTRDRNRIALQSDLLGAYSLGIRNILCLSGDHQVFGSQPDALGVFDIDSIQFVRSVRDMKETGRDMSGYELAIAPDMFVGAAANPFADPFEYRIIRLAKKIEAGARFIQTQCIFNTERFREWMRLAREEGLTEKVFILGGITPLKSAGMARYMAAKVAGMDIPEHIIRRMEGVPRVKAADEGMKIALETINELLECPGIRGIHFMAIENEQAVGRLVEAAGLMPDARAGQEGN